MALATLNGLAVLEARIHLPREGRWWADLVLDADEADALGGRAALDLGGALFLQGTVLRSGAWAGAVTAQVVAPTLLPGAMLLGRRVDHVEHRLGPHSVRTVVQFLDHEAKGDEGSTDGDQLLRVLDRRLARARFHRLFPEKAWESRVFERRGRGGGLKSKGGRLSPAPLFGSPGTAGV